MEQQEDISGSGKRLKKVRLRYYWLKFRENFENWCKLCDTCAASRGHRLRSRGRMHQYYFTKWPEVYAIPNQEASTVADIMVNKFVCRFGVPRERHSDQARIIESRLFREICERLGIRKTKTTPLHPLSDGMVERYINTIEEHLRKVASTNQRNRDETPFPNGLPSGES